MARSASILFASKASKLRWAILAIIVGVALSVDYLMKRDIGAQVREAWLDACVKSVSLTQCERRVATHHPGCFDLAYESMIFTLGRQRWESFKLIDYEACMNRDAPPPGSTPGAGPVVDI